MINEPLLIAVTSAPLLTILMLAAVLVTMEVKNIHKHVGWYASYMNDDERQGKALIFCQQKKIEQLTKLIEMVGAEIELAEHSKNYDAETVLQSVKTLISQPQEVEHTEGYFKWEG